MQRLRRHIAPITLVMIFIATMVVGCHRKPLYLAQRGNVSFTTAVIDIHLDFLWGEHWEEDLQYPWNEQEHGVLGYTEPWGIRSIVYLLDEEKRRNEYLSRNMSKEGGRVNIVTKEYYDMLFYNNDTEYIILTTDKSTYYEATTRSNTKASYTRSYDGHNQPDQLFGTLLSDVYISDDPEDYVMEYAEDGSMLQVYRIDATLSPYTLIYLYQIIILNNNDAEGARVTGAEGITANGLASSVDLFTRATDTTVISLTQNDVKPIVANQWLHLPDGHDTIGDIFAARIQTWGLPGITPIQEVTRGAGVEPADSTFVGVGLTLRSGYTYVMQKNVTEQMKERPGGGVITLVIDAAKEIPDTLIYNSAPNDGFGASVNAWGNGIEADFTI